MQHYDDRCIVVAATTEQHRLDAGGAIYRSYLTGGAVVKDSILSGNRAGQHGGGIYDQNTEASAAISGNTFDRNQAPQGDGVMIRQGATKIEDNKGLPDSEVVLTTYAAEGSDYDTGDSSGIDPDAINY